MSSLAHQLQSIASLDAARLTSRTGAPTSKSYLFSAKEAAEQDLDAVWAIAQEGFEQLCALDPDMLEFEEELFAERTKRVDRMLLNKEENRVLDGRLERCLRRLGRWIGVMAGGKCLEWLVRRFR
jgi:U3 small nucleolar RNA-associated protein 10